MDSFVSALCGCLLGPAARDGEAASWSRPHRLASGAGLDAGRLISLSGSVAPGLAIEPGMGE